MYDFNMQNVERLAGDFLPKDREIEALIPIYSARGDETLLYLADGRKILVEEVVKTTLRRLSRRRCKDLRLIRKFSAKYTARKLNNPIAIGPELVLVPFKVREARVKGDTVMGFLNALKVSKVLKDKEGKSLILLKSRAEIFSLWDIFTLSTHLKEAVFLHEKMLLELYGVFFKYCQIKLDIDALTT